MHRAPPRAPGQGHDRADAGRQPDGLRPGRDRRGRATSGAFLEKPTPDEITLRHDQRRHLRARAGHVRPDSRRTRRGRSSAATSRRSSSAARRSSPTSTAATGSTSARRRSTGRCTATSWTAASTRRRSTARPARARRRRRTRASRTARVVEGPCFVDAGVGRQGRRAHRPLHACIGRHCHVDEDAVVDGAILWPNTLGRPRGASSTRRDRRPPLPRRPQRRRSAPAPCSATSRSSPTTRGLTASRDALTDACHDQPRHLQGLRRPRPLSRRDQRRRGARRSAAAFVAYLGADAHRRRRATCALSSPALAAAFIEGARAQGADVVDYGMVGTDMLYFAVARDGLDGGAQITASHNPEAVQRHQDGARARRSRSAATPASARSAT